MNRLIFFFFFFFLENLLVRGRGKEGKKKGRDFVFSFPVPVSVLPGNLRLRDDGLSLFDLQHVSSSISYPSSFHSVFLSALKKRNKMVDCVERERWEWCRGLRVGLDDAFLVCRPCQLSFCRQVFFFPSFFYRCRSARSMEKKTKKTERVLPFSRTLWWGQTGGLVFLFVSISHTLTKRHTQQDRVLKPMEQLSSVTVLPASFELSSGFSSFF